jgi:hypothetical protein
MNSSEPQDSLNDENVEDESNTKSSDTQSMINDLMNSVSKDEKESFKDSFDDSEAKKQKEILDEQLKKDFALNQGMPLPNDEEINFYKNLVGMLNNFCSFKEGELNAHESKIVSIRKYYKKILSLNGREDISSYNEIVKKNKKNIIGLTNYFKLRFQNKERNKLFNNREEGIINNNDLFKILIKNKNENTIFSKIESSVVNKSNIVFLLDFSSSMRGDNVKSVIETMIVMNEVFSKLKIPYEIYSFSGSGGGYRLKYSKKIKSITSLFDSSITVKPHDRKLGQSTIFLKESSKNILFQLRSLKDNEYSTDKKILGKLYNETRNGGPTICDGSTPELEAVMCLRKNIHFSNKKLFILNDGEYNTIYGDTKMSEEQKTLISNESKYSSIPIRILHSLLNGGTFTLNSPSDIDILKNLSSFLRNISSGGYNVFSYFYRQKDLNSQKIQEVYSFANMLSIELSDLDYNSLLKKDKIKLGSFGVIQVNVTGKNISLSFKLNESEFSILNTEPDTNALEKGMYTSVYLGQKEWDWKCISTLICYSCLKQGNHYSSELMNDRIYKSLIDKMRIEGWYVCGLGINSRRAKKYIGEKFFTVVNSNKVQETLLGNVREIV